MAIVESLLMNYNMVKILAGDDNFKIENEPMFTFDEIATDYLNMQQDCQVVLERMGC